MNVPGWDAEVKLPRLSAPESGCLMLILLDRHVILCDHVLDFTLRDIDLPNLKWDELYMASVSLVC